MNMNRGYSGYSRSKRAAAAEKEGKLPLSRAIKVVASEAGISQKLARAILQELGPCEWHHISKYCNITNYYNVSAAVDRSVNDNIVKALKDFDFRRRHEEALNILKATSPGQDSPDNRHWVLVQLHNQFKNEYGNFSYELTMKAYYGTWGEE